MPRIYHQTYIKVEPKRVYEALVTAEGWNTWFTDETTIMWNDDGTGEIRLRWSNYGIDKIAIEDGGKILEAIPYECFVFQWSPGESVTTVKFLLKPYKEGTMLRIAESGYSESDRDIKACIGCAVGWGEALNLLKVYLEHGIVYKEDLI